MRESGGGIVVGIIRVWGRKDKIFKYKFRMLLFFEFFLRFYLL